jgi:hypothetical protein
LIPLLRWRKMRLTPDGAHRCDLITIIGKTHDIICGGSNNHTMSGCRQGLANGRTHTHPPHAFSKHGIGWDRGLNKWLQSIEFDPSAVLRTHWRLVHSGTLGNPKRCPRKEATPEQKAKVARLRGLQGESLSP